MCIRSSQLASPVSECQRHRARRAVINDILDYSAHQPARIALLEELPVAFCDLQLAPYFLTTQCGAKLSHDRVLDPDGRNSLGGARIPAVAARPLADVVSKRPAPLGRAGRDHTAVARIAKQ